jgi:D-alanyl-D-alanine carboxypeptidase (penicillin-binding protein 5/6)
MIKPSPAPSPLKKAASKRNSADSPLAVIQRLSLFIVACAVGGLFSFAVDAGQMHLENYFYAQISAPIDQIGYVARKAASSADLNLDALAVISLRVTSAGRERMIYKKNDARVLPIASLTKLMTATVVLENPDVYGMDNVCTVSSAAAGQDDVPVAGNLKVGETYSVRQLLSMMLYYSSNNAAWALSEAMDTDKFVAAMNRKATDLGLGDTAFYNPTGLDPVDHVVGGVNHSSADDLMVLVKYILRAHPEIFSYTDTGQNYVTDNGIFDVNLWDGQKLVGGKTGFTDNAGGCMILVYESANGRRYINILLGSTSAATRVAEMQKLVNFANNYDKPAEN